MNAVVILVLVSLKPSFAFVPRAHVQLSRSPISNNGLFSATAPVEKAVEDKFEDGLQHRLLSPPIPYDQLTIGVLREVTEGETRVSQTPDSVATLVKKGFHVLVEAGGKGLVKSPFLPCGKFSTFVALSNFHSAHSFSQIVFM